MSFVFWDTETTGMNTAFDQILQFGAIRTDHELRELERFDIRCRLLPYVVPSPGALLTTGIGIDQLTDTALPSHYQMVRAIKSRLEEWSPALFIGHNSMRFDEHLLRQAFYQTLHPPYLTNTNGNGRLDSLPVFQAVHLLEPGTLSVPVNEKGRPTFSLDQLAPANGFAYDAVGEAEATLYLCRIVAERAAGYWSTFVRFARKASVLDFVEECEVFAFLGFDYGRAHVRMVTAIGSNPDYDSEVFVFDLSHDPHELASLSDDHLHKLLAASPKSVSRLRANAAPCILPYEDVPAQARVREPGIDDLRCRAGYIRDDEGFAQRLIAAMVSTREARESSVHVEEQIYDSFTGPEDQAGMATFHEAEWTDRPALLGRLSDTRLQVLGERLLYTEAPEVMPEPGQSRYRADVARHLITDEGTVPWLTLPQAIRKTDELLADLTGAEASLLRGLRAHLVGRAAEAKAIME